MTTATLKPLLMADLQRPLEDGVPPPHLVQLTPPPRLDSLDIFRGITIAAMLLVNNPGSWSHVYDPLEHATWHGWTMTDLIFPFFLFIVGVAIPFSLGRRAALGRCSRGRLLAQIWTRSLSLMLLGWLMQIPMRVAELPEGYTVLRVLRVVTYGFVGLGILSLLVSWKSRRVAMGVPLAVAALLLLLYWSHHFANQHALAAGLPEGFEFGTGLFTPHKLRIPGVLVRIGACYGVAASIALFAGWRTVLASAVVLMAAYSALMLGAPYPRDHTTGSLTARDNLARRIDEDLFRQHNYAEYPDPEGLLSTLPAVASVLLGILAGKLLRREQPAAERCAALLAWGVGVSITGVLLSWWLMPINKKIWTPSFSVFTAGMAMLGLGAIFYAADVRGRRWWALPFQIFGVNAIAAFVLAGVVGRLASLVTFAHPNSGRAVTLLTFCRDGVESGVHVFSHWLRSLNPSIPPMDSANNLSLAWAIAFVLFIFLVMSVLYISRIFIKV